MSHSSGVAQGQLLKTGAGGHLTMNNHHSEEGDVKVGRQAAETTGQTPAQRHGDVCRVCRHGDEEKRSAGQPRTPPTPAISTSSGGRFLHWAFRMYLYQPSTSRSPWGVFKTLGCSRWQYLKFGKTPGRLYGSLKLAFWPLAVSKT